MYHDDVKEDSKKYQGLGCSQLKDTFWATSNGVVVIDKIMAQLGSRDNEDLLAILFKDVNGMKFRALARDDRSSIVAISTWQKSSWREKYSHLKRVGGVASYMKTSEIEKMFVTASNGVYDVMSASDAFKFNLAPRYALWMDHLIKAYNEGMKSFVQSKAKELFDAHSSGSSTGYTQQEVNNLERMAKNGNPNFDMWWSRKSSQHSSPLHIWRYELTCFQRLASRSRMRTNRMESHCQKISLRNVVPIGSHEPFLYIYINELRLHIH